MTGIENKVSGEVDEMIKKVEKLFHSESRQVPLPLVTRHGMTVDHQGGPHRISWQVRRGSQEIGFNLAGLLKQTNLLKRF